MMVAMPEWTSRASWLNRAWIAASAALPIGWRLEGVTCASTGLAPEQRSDRWRATAASPAGETVTGEAGSAAGALQALARELLTLRGSMSG